MAKKKPGNNRMTVPQAVTLLAIEYNLNVKYEERGTKKQANKFIKTHWPEFSESERDTSTIPTKDQLKFLDQLREEGYVWKTRSRNKRNFFGYPKTKEEAERRIDILLKRKEEDEKNKSMEEDD